MREECTRRVWRGVPIRISEAKVCSLDSVFLSNGQSSKEFKQGSDMTSFYKNNGYCVDSIRGREE